MTDLETRLRATYAAVAEQTSVAPLDATTDADLVDLQPVASSGRRAGWWAAAAAFVLLAGAVGVARLRSDPVAAPADTDRPFAIPMVLPAGFGLVDWSTDRTGLPGFGEVPVDAAVASLDYLGPGGEIHVRSTATFGDPTATPRTDTLSTGALVHTKTVGEGTTLAWVADSGAAVSVTATGVAVDELLKIAEVVWYATAKSFAAATETGGFGSQTFERWQPPGDRFDGSEIRLTGALQISGIAFSLELMKGLGMPPGPFTSCLAHAGGDGTGRLVLTGPSDAKAFFVILPDGTARRVPVGTPPWSPVSTFATVEFDSSLRGSEGQVSAGCEVER